MMNVRILMGFAKFLGVSGIGVCSKNVSSNRRMLVSKARCVYIDLNCISQKGFGESNLNLKDENCTRRAHLDNC